MRDRSRGKRIKRRVRIVIAAVARVRRVSVVRRCTLRQQAHPRARIAMVHKKFLERARGDLRRVQPNSENNKTSNRLGQIHRCRIERHLDPHADFERPVKVGEPEHLVWQHQLSAGIVL